MSQSEAPESKRLTPDMMPAPQVDSLSGLLRLCAKYNNVAEIKRSAESLPDLFDADLCDKKNWITPLHVAAECGQIEAAQCLVGMKAGVNHPDLPTWNTPLFRAARNNWRQMCQCLLRLKADITHKNAEGQNVIEYAKSQTASVSVDVLAVLEVP